MYPTLIRACVDDWKRLYENKFMEISSEEKSAGESLVYYFFHPQENYFPVQVLNVLLWSSVLMNIYSSLGRISAFVKFYIVLIITCMNWKIR